MYFICINECVSHKVSYSLCIFVGLSDELLCKTAFGINKVVFSMMHFQVTHPVSTISSINIFCIFIMSDQF